MSISERYIQIGNEECLIHLPVKPNGYAILILGDRNHYIHNGSSFWMQHPVRKQLFDNLLNEGYTIFYSNQGGAHWGNERLSSITERLTKYVLKNEIVNEHIHIFAEGMGALIALRLMVNEFFQLRSVILFNPCIDIKAHYDDEKNNRFFYKRFIQEMTRAFEIEESEVEEMCIRLSMLIDEIPDEIPIRVFQAVYQAPYSPDSQARPLIRRLTEKQREVTATFFLPGKTLEQFSKPLISFFKAYEKDNLRK
ncbi:hypothetical protein SAMN05421736_10582 [Evansella caseinilytica]|uniref:Serine aminopeptidase S33 family n=1 Tax=Evansella caseinilytica TaxID=1503961 RepID=A0A1H3PJW4_9BACI|nr:hypothetical protein [Evansella caseinilytica]SDZ01377.1 hypothetical protein SAMN05421736_10582 [Evansella caseinilytica]